MIHISDHDLDKAVFHTLSMRVGKGNAIERWTLVNHIFGVSVPAALQNDDNSYDRMIRAAVSRLRAQGHLICDLGNGNGRYMAANEAEFWEMYSGYVKPIVTRAQIARAMKKSALRCFPNLLQPSLFTVMDAVEDLEAAL